MSPIAPGDMVEVEILDAGEGNRSFARLDNGMGAFIRGTHIPGDRVEARVARIKKRHAELSFVRRVVSSPDRIEPPCRWFGRCGGCRWQQIQYERQLEIKRKTVADALRRLGGFGELNVEAARPSPNSYEYRNKVDLVFSRKQAQSTPSSPWSLGFHVQGASQAVLNVENCHLISSRMNRVAYQVRCFAEKQGWQAYDAKKGAGLLRSLMIRQAHRTGQIMVNLVTSGPVPHPENLVECFHPSVTTLINSISTAKNRMAVEKTIVVSGPGKIEEQFCGLAFEVSPSSFLQTNTPMADALYREVCQQADLQADDRVLDLYCGIGTLTLLLAGQAGHVLGIESVEDAVRNAIANAGRNGIENVEFRREILGRGGEPKLPPDLDVIITDPPRDGMERGVIAAIRRSNARRLIYVSCHPAHLARDAARLCEGGLYKLKTVLPFDLFPQTAHIETLAVFDRNSNQV